MSKGAKQGGEVMAKAKDKAVRARNRRVSDITLNLHKVIVALSLEPKTLWDLDTLRSLSNIMVRLVEGEEVGTTTSGSRP